VQVAGDLAARRGRGESQRPPARSDAAEISYPEGRGGSRAEGSSGERSRCGRGNSKERRGDRCATAKAGCRQANQSERAGSQGEFLSHVFRISHPPALYVSFSPHHIILFDLQSNSI